MTLSKENLHYGEELLLEVLASLRRRGTELQLPNAATPEMRLLATLLMTQEIPHLQEAMFRDPATAVDLSSQARAHGENDLVLYKAYGQVETKLPDELADGFIARIIISLVENTATIQVVDSDLTSVLEFTMGVSAVSAAHMQIVLELQANQERRERTYSL